MINTHVLPREQFEKHNNVQVVTSCRSSQSAYM